MAARPDTIGCDIGGTSIQFTLLRGSRRLETFEKTTPLERSRFLAELSGGILRLLESRRRGGLRRAAAVGVGFCGLLDERRRSVVRSTSLPELNGCRLAASLERRTGLQVTLDTDTNAGAVAEAAMGAARGFSRALYVSLGTGIGVALVVAGRPVRVSHHTVGQVADIRLADACGSAVRFVRAEGLLSARGILRRARRRGLRELRSTADLHASARAGDAAALAIWREFGEILGGLLHILVTLWSPDVVVIGGGTAGAAEFFLRRARRELRRASPRTARLPPLRTARAGRLAGAVGAALLARADGAPPAAP